MAVPIRVMIQMQADPLLTASSYGPIEAAPAVDIANVPGVQLDYNFAPVPLPPSPLPMAGSKSGANKLAEMYSAGEQSTYILRAAVAAESMENFRAKAKDDPRVVGIFSDPLIQPFAACPSGPVGTEADVATLLSVAKLNSLGLDGSGVRVAIVDTGVNLPYLNNRGKNPGFDSALSWGPQSNMPLGNLPVNHGTMCAFDVCIAAPNCTIVDHAVLTSTAHGGSTMDGLLSDAVKSYGVLLSWISKGPGVFPGDQVPRALVVNNSWGMFNPSWDFPVGDPGNYSDNPQHPFNIIVTSLESAGADILFAAGNCGPECPDTRCQGATNNGIYGANSSPSVICVAGVTIDKVRLGYSTKGPGRLEKDKPDIASFTHFAGSGVYPADGGTSAATPVLTGVVAAIRKLYPPGVVSPSQLRTMLCGPAGQPFDYELGYGVVNVTQLLKALGNLPKN